MGRRSKVETLVDAVERSEVARERAKVILLTMGGGWSVREGFERLGVSRTRFQDLRRRMLDFACHALEERPAGRPRSRPGEPDGEVVELQQEFGRLRHELVLLESELAIARSEVGPAVATRLAQKAGRR